MAITLYYMAVIIAFSSLLLVLLFSRKSKRLGLVFKIASLVLGLVLIVRHLWGDDAIQDMFALESDVFNGKFINLVALILVWLTYSSTLLMSLYGFFKVKLYNKFIYFIALPITVLNLFLLPIQAKAIVGANALTVFSPRGFILGLEIGFTFAYSLFVLLNNLIFNKQPKEAKQKRQKQPFKTELKLLGKKVLESLPFVFCFIAIIFSTIPAYTIQALFGAHESLYSCLDFELPHRFILYIGFILPFIVYFALKKFSHEEKKFYLLFISLGTLLSFSILHRFESFLDPTDWPLHLCNTAMYIMPIVLIFNMKKFFYFTYFINVAGALFAMLMPNYSSGVNMYSTSLVVFYINHYIAFFMPILFVALGMFEKPKFKQFVYSMLGFLAYFVLVLFINALFTGLHKAGLASQTTDYFFLNSDFIASKLGEWAENLMKIKTTLTFGKVELLFFPIYQLLFFLAYVGIGVATWFVYAQGFEIANSFVDIGKRKEKIKLDMLALNIKGENMKDPVSPENKDKLILINFSKKYGSSKVFAVKDANLEVHGGEIFGFLGPNGAGKSTIIKSMVGIQPITSGRIEVCGYDMSTQPIEVKSNIGFVPDHYALYEKLTGREYINYIADLYNVSKQDREERINNMVNRFELSHSFDSQMKTYSHGMKQKIAIMAALVHDPKVWILDEPLTGLDPNSIFQVKECMKEHAMKGNIVFFSSHIIDVVEKICDRIAIIKKGVIQCTKSVEEIESSGVSLEQFYINTIENGIEKKKKDE